MTATDELRRMLTDAGVEWEDMSVRPCTCTSWLDPDGEPCTALEGADDIPDGKLSVQALLTPEQAIAATVGRGTCHKVLDFDGTAWICSECGEHIGPRRWNYCPNCGRKVVDE